VTRSTGANQRKKNANGSEAKPASSKLKPALALGSAAALALGGWALWPEDERKLAGTGSETAAKPAATALGGPSALPPFSDREAAEWGLKYKEGINSWAGGAMTGVKVRLPNLLEKHIKTSAELPKEPFTVTEIHCMPPDEQKNDAAILGRITDADVIRLASLKDVKKLYVHGRLTGRSLATIMQLPSLEVLHFPGAQLQPVDFVVLKDSKLRELGLVVQTIKAAG
jgi:hypothetical protein